MSKAQNSIDQFLETLRKTGYQGEVFTDKATRIINATDNSIYQVMPEVVLAPRTVDDLDHIMQAGQGFSDVAFMARGGGTGTNGQALNDCVIIDTSKHLTDIIEINEKEGWVRVQPGVVLDVLQDALKPYGLFFPQHVSPSKSATIGGMVSTDACGKGSRAYGKTSDYIINMHCILADGSEIETQTYQDQNLNTLIAQDYDNATQSMPDLPRGVSGYNLKAYDPDSHTLNLNKLIAGSEGSLALIKEITLRVIPRSKHRVMFCVAYDSFDTALRHVAALLEHDPVAVETIDDHILNLARTDILWHSVQSILPPDVSTDTIKAIHFVEFEAEDNQTFAQFLTNDTQHKGFVVLNREDDIKQASALRSKCVGLLGNMEGVRRPLPFMEDTAVPPQNLADYIADLKTMLAGHNLVCGIFGHVDAGCLHVRPALDLRHEEDQALIRTLSNETVQIVKKHGGIFWGEHGKGMRAEYITDLLGTPYYETMQRIKTYFDPGNRLNPGKIATTVDKELRKIDEIPLRGQFDSQIKEEHLKHFEKSIQCNGNGQCFSAMTSDTMCPSYKVTRDRRHSPKGRAGLLREWLRLKSINPEEAQTFEPEVYEALSGCLSCKACTSVCPIHVNIPDMKAQFLSQYFRGRTRQIRDYLIANAETFAYVQSYLPFTLPGLFGLIDVPRPSRPNLRTLMKQHGFQFADKQRIDNAKNLVLIVQDAYTSTYEVHIVLATLQLLKKLGFDPLVLPFRQSGKSWHVMGFINKFKQISEDNAAYFKQFKAPLIGIDPSMTLIYRDEYKGLDCNVLLLHEFLEQNLPDQQKDSSETYKLFQHCTESTMLPASSASWINIFKQFGAGLEYIQTGCCGMAGSYGHMEEHRENSLKLYDMNWYNHKDDSAVVTGYSCRSQIKRCENEASRHPVEILNELL